MQQTGKIGFAILTLDKKLWRGKALWTHLKKEGPEYEVYNQQPMFRYNTYFGINTVHYLDLKETTPARHCRLSPLSGRRCSPKWQKVAPPKARRKECFHFSERFCSTDWILLNFYPLLQTMDSRSLSPSSNARRRTASRLAFHPGAFSDELSLAQTGN